MPGFGFVEVVVWLVTVAVYVSIPAALFLLARRVLSGRRER